MKILFQGGWKTKRDQPQTKEIIEAYCKALAKFIVNSNHTIVLTSNSDYDELIANEISIQLNETPERIKEKILFLLPNRINSVPKIGTVHKFDHTKWWQEERTYIIQQVDSLIAIGGGKGTADSIEKAILMNIPVFVVGQISCASSRTWKKRPKSYHYLEFNDTDFTEDLNTNSNEFFLKTFSILDKFSARKISRNIFVVHGRDHHERDKLVLILKKLDFKPIVLSKEPNAGLTIIEKLERDINNVGFGFVLYTPDDLGKLKDGIEKPRARQNVIFEHGYLFGLLGRSRTCALLKGDVEFPSDLDGVIYEKYSNLENESMRIVKILKDFGYEVNPSKLLE